MHSSLIPVVLCISAQASLACLPVAGNAAQTAPPLRTHMIKAQAASGELIASATAGTREVAAAPRTAPQASARPDPQRPRRAGPAMLLAALALMSGIALRRYSAGSR